MTREELYSLVWEMPMMHAASKYGLSGNGLAKICRRLDVPYPSRGWWAKKAAGKKLRQTPLPKPKSGTPRAINIPVREREAQRSVTHIAPLRKELGAITVPERLAKAHPIIAGWRAEHERRRADAARERDPMIRRAFVVPEFTETERRMHRALHALLRALEQQGATIGAAERHPHRIVATIAREDIEFEIREKLKQLKRPLNEDERRWSSDRSRLVTELVGTGRLHVVIHTWSGGGFKREWLESDAHPIETLLPDVAATLLAMGPHLAEVRREREEEARRAEERRRRAEEERRLRQRDANRWRRFVEFARASEEVRQARAFLVELRERPSSDEVAGDRSIEEWLDWAESRAAASDPLKRDMPALFSEIAEVTEWTYRD